MKNIDYIKREYVPSIDLQTLDKTFNTLETGHKEAVKAASDLQVAMANLDLNEADEGYRQQKINEIKQTVADNTIYGNSFGAIDDLIMKAGDLSSDAGMIGRLNSQKNFKAFQDKVDKMAIPEGMKEMYKEANPYHYEDGPIDERTGKVTKGKIWEATDNPVNSIAKADIQKQALAIAAEEAGSGQRITFLDEYGKETPDPSKSVDGAFYRQIGSSYHRLSEDKIKKAYKIAIDSIPGAEDSLRQDHRYAMYEYNKLSKKAQENGQNPNPYMEGITDKNGNVYNYEDWLEGQIDGFAKVASYNRVTSTTNFGGALENRRKAEQAKEKAAQNAGTNPNIGGGKGFGVNRVGWEEVNTNAFAEALKSTSTSNEIGLKAIKSVTSEFNNADSLSDVFNYLINSGKATGPGSAAKYFIDNYGANIKKEDIRKRFERQITDSFTSYYYSNTQKNEYLKKAGKDADYLKFSANVSNDEFTNDNEYGSKMINRLNKFYTKNKYADFTIGKNVLSGIAKQYGYDNIEDLKKLGIDINIKDDESYTVKIDSKHRNRLPRFSYYLKMSNDSLPGTFLGWSENTFTKGVDENNYSENSSIGAEYSNMSRPGNNYRDSADYFGNLYEQGINAASDVEKKIGIAHGTKSKNSYSASSYGEMYYREHSDQFTPAELNSLIKDANDIVDKDLSTGQINSGAIKEIDKNGNIKLNIKNSQDIQTLIQQMYSNDSLKSKIKREVIAPSGSKLGEARGYIVSFTVPKDLDNDSYTAGQQVRFIIEAPNIEAIDYNPSYNPDTIAVNAEATARATNSGITNFGYDNNLGETNLSRNNDGTYNCAFMGTSKKLTSDEAIEFTSYLYSLNVMKANLMAGSYSGDKYRKQLFINSLIKLSTNIANITGKNINTVQNQLNNYLVDQTNF